MAADREVNPGRPLAVAFATGAAVLALSALALRTPLPGALHPAGELPPGEAAEAARWSAASGVLALGLAGVALLLRRRRAPLGRATTRLALVGLVTLVPSIVCEAWAAPFVERPTSLFTRDPELGWRLVPGSEDSWLGARVRINEEGLRGPARGVAKPAGTRRVLFLGDSVVFGAFLPSDEDTLPAQVERLLAADGPVECLNAGVGGYSPWQEALVLERRGLAYTPDLVVLGFVLNDVTEKLELQRFGGEGEGFQLEHAVQGGPGAWLERSNVVRWLRARRSRRSARLDVWTMIREPNRDDVQAAWRSTQASLDRVRELCEGAGVPLLVVCFPYAEQLLHDGLDSPQVILGWWAGRRPIAYLDLLPPLAEAVRGGRLEAARLFVDQVHPSASGAAVMAELIASEIRRAGLLPPGGRAVESEGGR